MALPWRAVPRPWCRMPGSSHGSVGPVAQLMRPGLASHRRGADRAASSKSSSPETPTINSAGSAAASQAPPPKPDGVNSGDAKTAPGTPGGPPKGVWTLDALRLLRPKASAWQMGHLNTLLDGAAPPPTGSVARTTTGTGPSGDPATDDPASTSGADAGRKPAAAGKGGDASAQSPGARHAPAAAGSLPDDSSWLYEMLTPPAPLAGAFEKKARMALQTTEFDQNGDVKETNGKYLKSDLCAIHQLQPRDLRVIDNFRSEMPAVLVRSSAVVVNLEHIKALIKADSVILFDTEHPDRHHLSLFIFDLQDRLRSTGATTTLPYELRALEAIMISVCSVLRDQYNQMSPKVAAALRRLEGDIERTTLLTLLDMTRKLTRLEARVNGILEAVNEILDSDDDMAGMYLTTKLKTGLSQPTTMHEEVEFMFEYYSKQLGDIQAQTAELLSNIRTTQTVVKITLDAQRNSLLLLELRLTMGTFAIGCGGLVAGLFGMNLQSGLEHQPLVFYGVGASVFLLSTSAFLYFLRRMSRLVRNRRLLP